MLSVLYFSRMAFFSFTFVVDTFVATEMINNGEKYELSTIIKLDGDSRVVSSYGKNDRAFSIKGVRGAQSVRVCVEFLCV